MSPALIRRSGRHSRLQAHIALLLIFTCLAVARSSESSGTFPVSPRRTVRARTNEAGVDPYPQSFRIFDIVLYHDEAYMLYIRLRTLRAYVDRHYIGFSLFSFSHNVEQKVSFAPLEEEIQAL
jgi:hypothetical protein